MGGTGREKAMELFREVSPDLVLLDITMPGRSGLEVLEEMLGLVPNVRVIMCSAVGQEMMIQKAPDHRGLGLYRKTI